MRTRVSVSLTRPGRTTSDFLNARTAPERPVASAGEGLVFFFRKGPLVFRTTVRFSFHRVSLYRSRGARRRFAPSRADPTRGGRAVAAERYDVTSGPPRQCLSGDFRSVKFTSRGATCRRRRNIARSRISVVVVVGFRDDVVVFVQSTPFARLSNETRGTRGKTRNKDVRPERIIRFTTTRDLCVRFSRATSNVEPYPPTDIMPLRNNFVTTTGRARGHIRRRGDVIRRRSRGRCSEVGIVRPFFFVEFRF